MPAAANTFLQLLSGEQREKAQFIFDTEERYNWHYIPKDDRKGVSFNEMNEGQKKAALSLLHTALSDTGYNRASSIMQLENVLHEVENRSPEDKYRDPGKYFISIFGHPDIDSIWGWRLEGHHVSFNFSFADKKLVAGTPSFLGSNPAVVLSGPEKGKQVLRDETELGFTLLHSLTSEQLKKAVFSNEAPGEIFTAANRKAMIENPQGILYNELTASQQKLLLQLLSLYIHRYTRFFAQGIMHEIETAGLDKLYFAWAGTQQPGVGNPHYYRLQGPSIIIEYDNTQNNANHVHTVIRDLNNDFGGDELMEHYRKMAH
ncbi:MAG: DUF3500 domain-containing protein [Bacteroidetes bacterium]|nr:DUF3500 domain-containing protein [Bacteroidota bacterium]